MSTSLQVFRAHLRSFPSPEHGGMVIDASQIHSRACYLDWLASRGINSNIDSEALCKKFQRSLSNHVSGVDGRSSFEPEEEEAILKVLRRKECWPCFPVRYKIGSMGYRSRGFHEKHVKGGGDGAAAAAVAAAIPANGGAVMSFSPMDIQGFASHILQYSSSFAAFGIDVSTSIYGLFTLFCQARLPSNSRRNRFAQSPAYAQELCERLSLQHGPECTVTIYSLGDYSKRILAQNARSKELLGDFSGKDAAVPRLIDASEWGKLVFGLGLAYSNPGVDVPLSFSYPVGKFDVKLYVDPQSFLNCSIGRLVS